MTALLSPTPASADLPARTPAPAGGALLAPELTAAIAAAAERAEAQRHLPPELVDTLAAADLFRLSTPVEHGGLELGLTATATTIETIATVDASTAWCVWNGSCGFAAPLLEPGAAEAVFGTGRPVGNSAHAGGTAIAEPGGYRLTGSWNIVSGSDHQPWIILFALVVDADGAPVLLDGGRPDLRACFVRREQCRIVDRWHVLGMRPTSSNEVVVDGAHVPADLAIDPFAPARIDRTLYRIPVFLTASIGGAAACLGVAAAAIDDVLALAPTKATIHGTTLAANADAQAALAEQDARLRAARAGFHAALDDVTATAAAGEPVTAVQRGRVRASMVHAASTAKTVTLRMFELASSSAIHDAHPLNRRLRDVLVAGQHVMVQPLWYEQAGRTLLDLPPTLPIL